MSELMRTPVTLDNLDKEHALFTGSSEETLERATMFGSVEVTGNYPAVFLQRSLWEDVGKPVLLTLVLEGEDEQTR